MLLHWDTIYYTVGVVSQVSLRYIAVPIWVYQRIDLSRRFIFGVIFIATPPPATVLSLLFASTQVLYCNNIED